MRLLGLTLLVFVGFVGGVAKASDFVTMVLEKNLDVPATVAWTKIGGFCQIDQWMNLTCVYKSGTGEPGTVRAMNSQGRMAEEVEVSRTPLSYTYISATQFLPLYHGTMSVEPTGTTTSKIVYTFFWDQESLSPEQRQKARATLTRAFTPALDKMKQISETK